MMKAFLGALLVGPAGAVALRHGPRAVARATAPFSRASPIVNVAPVAERKTLDSRLYTLNSGIINSAKGLIDVIYQNNPYARFYVLETVARVPYFAYLSVLHLRETLGARDEGLRQRMRLHYGQADNELHHLLIMESLGGNSSAVDRSIAQTMAFGYYWYVVFVFSLSEPAAYHLSELIEDHAFNTYDAFLSEKAAELRTLPVPDIARAYYEQDDPFLFNMLSIGDTAAAAETVAKAVPAPGRPTLTTLYDVFECVRNDEKGHWGSLCNLVQTGSPVTAEGCTIGSTQPGEPEESLLPGA